MRLAAPPLLALGIGLAASLAGCASVPAIDSSDEAPAFAAGPLQPTSRGVSCADLVRPAGTAALYRIIEGDDSGKTLRESMSSPPSSGSTGPIVREEHRDGTLTERMELRSDAAGVVSLEKVHTFAERSQSWFDPALPFAADLASGARLAGSADMKVYAIPARKPRAKGTAERSLEVAGECDVTVLGARMRAVALDLRFTVRLDVAHADVESRLFVVPGRGIVAEHRTEKRTILGILSSSSSETIVLEKVLPGRQVTP